MTYAASSKHDPILEVAPDVFIVRGSLKMNRFVSISRNMGIIRHEGELSLINPIRLTEEGERQLKELGTVKHIIRLGSFHGLDDRYYVEQLGAKLWSQPGGQSYTEPDIDVELDANTTLPFPDAELFLFKKPTQPECALLIKREDGILFTCDAIQHYGDYRFVTWFARPMLRRSGFPKTTLIGPFWLKFLTPEGESLRDEFDNLLELQFDKLLSGHGSFLASGAHAGVEKAVKKAFAD